MKTLEECKEELKKFCSAGLSFPADFDIYRNINHKGIQCSIHNTIHVVSMKEWKAFTRQVSGSAILSNKEKSSFIDLAVSPLNLRSFYTDFIEATADYQSLTYLFEKQDEVFASYLKSYVPIEEDQADVFDIGEIYNPVTSTWQLMKFSELERFKLILSLQKEVTSHTKKISPIILAHFASKMDARASSLWEKLDIRQVFNPQLCLKTLQIQDAILISEVNNLEYFDVKRYMVVKFRGSEEKYFLTKYDWKTAQYKAASNKVIYQIISSSQFTSAEDVFIEYFKENQYWKEVDSIVSSSLVSIESYPKNNLEDYLSYALNESSAIREKLHQFPQVYEDLGIYKLSSGIKRATRKMRVSKPMSSEIALTRESLENLLYSEDDEMLKSFYICKRKNAYGNKASTFYPIMINGNGTMEPYQCDECSLWHVGHKPSDIERPLTYYSYQARKYIQYELEKLG